MRPARSAIVTGRPTYPPGPDPLSVALPNSTVAHEARGMPNSKLTHIHAGRPKLASSSRKGGAKEP